MRPLETAEIPKEFIEPEIGYRFPVGEPDPLPGLNSEDAPKPIMNRVLVETCLKRDLSGGFVLELPATGYRGIWSEPLK